MCAESYFSDGKSVIMMIGGQCFLVILLEYIERIDLSSGIYEYITLFQQ